MEHPNKVFCNVMSPDRKHLAVGNGRDAIQMWDWQTKTKAKTIDGSTFPLLTRNVILPVFTSDSRLMAYRKELNVVLLNMEDYSVEHLIEWDKAINSIIFSPNDRLLAMNSDIVTDVYDLNDYSFVQNYKT